MDDFVKSAAPAEGSGGRHPALNLPNILTYGRIAAVPVLVVCQYLLEGELRHWVAFSIFAAASITDWLDGYLARIWSQQSAVGRMLDPIADKLLVGAALLMLVFDQTITGPAIFAAAIILCREILVSGLREFLAELNVKVLVSKLAKWKTAVQMVALAVLLIGPAGERFVPGTITLGLSLMWLAAILTLWTGFDYLKAALVRAIEEGR